MGLVLHWFWPTEWSLHRENIWVLLSKVSPHCHSCCLLLASTNTESRVIIGKVRLSYFGHQEWEDSWSLLLFIRTVTIHEDIFSSAMTVKVAVKSQRSFLCELHYEIFSMVNSWMEDLTWVLPSPVEITTSQRAPVIAIDDTVWIKHWHNLKNKLVSQLMCFRVIRHQEIDDPLHHEWGVRLSWMDPSSDHDTLFLLVYLERHPICDGQVLALVASYSPAKRVPRDVV